MARKHTEQWTLRNISRRFKKNKINLNPDYQRNSVWTLSQKQLLIDSIIRDIDIPKIYFRERPDEVVEAVDGQQRIRTIVDFMANKFPFSKDADNFEGEIIAGKHFHDLSENFTDEFEGKTLDVVLYSVDYTDEEVEETFLRLQNGTPLNSAEKRRAITGTFRDLVAELGVHSVFTNIAAFADKRYAFEDLSAKMLHQQLSSSSSRIDIRPVSLISTYEANNRININDNAYKKTLKSLNSMDKAFSGVNGLKLKKYAFLDWSFVLIHLFDKYTLKKEDLPEIGKLYLNFEKLRTENSMLDEEKQSRRLLAFSDAARSDSVANMDYRSKVLLEEVLSHLQNLELKDEKRIFSDEQRYAILLRDDGKCQKCGVIVKDDFEIDHIKAYANGGTTSLDNAQLLCKACNRQKSAS